MGFSAVGLSDAAKGTLTTKCATLATLAAWLGLRPLAVGGTEFEPPLQPARAAMHTRVQAMRRISDSPFYAIE